MYIATDQIIDLRQSLRYLGVPLIKRSQGFISDDVGDAPSFLFGDNKSVVTSSTIPQSVLSKRQHILAYHRVREAIAAKILSFIHIDGKGNPADILSKHYDFAEAWPLLQPLLFWMGDPTTICNSKLTAPAQATQEQQEVGEW